MNIDKTIIMEKEWVKPEPKPSLYRRFMRSKVFRTTRRRWSDRDSHWWKFTWSREGEGYRPYGIVLDSGEAEYPGCSIRFRAFGITLIVELPQWVLKRATVFEPSRLPDHKEYCHYKYKYSREIGFIIANGALHIYYGKQTHDSLTDRSKCWFIPWKQWRFHRISLYDLKGEEFWTQYDRSKKFNRGNYDRQIQATENCPKLRILFIDNYDKKKIIATVHIEEREWLYGEKWFKWLSWFTKPKIRRDLSIEFSEEVGSKKSTWKGGVTGTGITMFPGEFHRQAFARFCGENDLTYIKTM